MNFLRADTPAFQTASTELAAALGAMGIPMCAERPWLRLEGASESVTYFFDRCSPCGAYKTAELVRAWDDHEWQRHRPRHPLSYIRLAFRNLARWRDHVHQGVAIGAIRRAGKVELLTLEQGRPITGEHNPEVPGPVVETDDPEMAMALLACGISPEPGSRWTRHAPHRFRFQPADPTGDFQAAVLALAWDYPRWWEVNPEHPWAYLICAFANKRWLLEKIRRTAPLVVMKQPNGFPAFLSAAAGDDAQRAFFRTLRG